MSLSRFKVNNTSVAIQLLNANTKEPLKVSGSVLECSNYLGIARSTVNNRADNNKEFLLNKEGEKEILVCLNKISCPV